ncbi:histidine kinase dimerization/phospho-acceptor domain-containing protein [Pantanalinema rosaneae CENA516]|uniref:histidine kinase dimerization/phospho-acceptor domain-containing protein n=1 Tax=Pantanalinema rosaneae TaxID=1620701 RepID=UPI003D6E0BC7
MVRDHTVISKARITRSQKLGSQRSPRITTTSLQPSYLSQLKTDFVTRVNHEFRTPLTVISTATELLKLYHPQLSDQKRQQYFQQIQAAIAQLIHLLETALAHVEDDL